VTVRCVPCSLLALYLPIVLAYDALSLASTLVRADTAALRGRLAAAHDLPELLRQRRAIQTRRTASSQQLRRALSPLQSPMSLNRHAKLVAAHATRAP
jgi:hypothetical protein